MYEKIQQVSSVGVTVFMMGLIAGGVGTLVWGHPGPVISGALVGVYFLFAIKVAPQWEKVALLRFGRYVGLRGPGIFTIIPVVDTLSRYVDQRVRVTKGDRGNRADARHGAGKRGCHRLLDGVERRKGAAGDRRFPELHPYGLANGAAGCHREA